MGDRIAGEWLRASETREVIEALTSRGAQARFVGGCVRDAIINRPVSDVDVATTADPNTAIRLLTDAGMRVIPTGFAHGTVTAVKGRRSFEITTLREDTQTFGRKAEVRFTDDWAKDAARRDFTMNALYADLDGTVHDPLGTGRADLAARRVRFIGEAADRIQEDYLRILRLFRFHAWYGDGAMEPKALVASAALTAGLELLSRERVGAEFRKTLAAPSPAVAMDMMDQTGVLARSLPSARARAPFAALEKAERRLGTSPAMARRLAFLVRGADPRDAGRELRLSNDEIAALRARRAPPALVDGVQAARALGYERGEEAARDVLLIQAADQDAVVDVDMVRAATEGADLRLPVSARDLMEAGMAPGPEIGAALKRVEGAWVESDFTLDKATLLDGARSAA